jgi:hypothetical protein
VNLRLKNVAGQTISGVLAPAKTLLSGFVCSFVAVSRRREWSDVDFLALGEGLAR